MRAIDPLTEYEMQELRLTPIPHWQGVRPIEPQGPPSAPRLRYQRGSESLRELTPKDWGLLFETVKNFIRTVPPKLAGEVIELLLQTKQFAFLANELGQQQFEAAIRGLVADQSKRAGYSRAAAAPAKPTTRLSAKSPTKATATAPPKLSDSLAGLLERDAAAAEHYSKLQSLVTPIPATADRAALCQRATKRATREKLTFNAALAVEEKLAAGAA